MTNVRKRFLQIPQGTESLYLEEAFRHRKIVYELDSIFLQWGYLPMETPVFDFFDIYRQLLTGKGKNIYRLIDREGDLLMLRSDITLFLAKQLGLALREEDLPVRVFYSDTILRHQDREDISKNEFFQIGAELIGVQGLDADLEILLLMERIFTALEIRPQVHIGSHGLLTTIMNKIQEHDFSTVTELIRNRETSELRNHLMDMDSLSPDRASFLTDLFSFIGTISELKTFLKPRERFIRSEEFKSIAYILELFSHLENLGFGSFYRVDFSELGSQPYYTGIVFQAYLDGIDSAAAAGGRYDKLLSSFGFDSPSVGFSFLLRKVESHIKGKFPLPSDIEKAPGDSFTERYKNAESLREKGKIITL